MAEQRVSYRYAKALFESAKDNNLVDQIYNDLVLINKVLTLVPEVASIARKPFSTPFRMKALYRALFMDKVIPETFNFIEFLVDKGRDYLLKDIFLQYQKLYYAFNNILSVEIFLPKDFSDEIKSRIVQKIEENTGKKVVPKYIIDPRILGGFKIKIDDWVYDATLRNKLNSLYNELVSTVKVN